MWCVQVEYLCEDELCVEEVVKAAAAAVENEDLLPKGGVDLPSVRLQKG